MVLPAIDTKTGIRIEFIFSFVKFASCEDLIILKIFAQRPRDIEDVQSIIKKKNDIDSGYIRKWLTEIEKAFPEKKFISVFEDIYKKKK
jgi:hypothetical protein